ncbi:ATP-grasp domain-containing protein [Dawidia soli]|uniref:ATP-grasp domain-containing protein n=1 Tax=Dawidia soli TaxID=2782352 RepID=A0AAP2D4W6_9BACT|nr:hypothetical protein [Dawidia soli]MBT1685368.1 hypothetical protein [Dawidia soli]
MALKSRIAQSNFFTKARHWEYWPFGIVQFPLFIYYGWLALRARSFTFFTASNPGITMGGMFGESKYDVLMKVPAANRPRTARVKGPATTETVVHCLEEYGFSLPVIFKPDIGERGFMVKRISSRAEIDLYLAQMPHDFIIQDLVDLPVEMGVFYVRLPSAGQGHVNSVVIKEMLSVTGDGVQTLQALILQKDRARLQWPALQQRFAGRLSDVVPAGESIELVSIGNHCLGTKFLDGTHLINDRLSETFDTVSKQIEGFYFGRFDLRCATVEDLYAGRFLVMELNGCGAEPAHIYHPGFPLSRALRILFRHWHTIFRIARENTARGVSYMPWKQAVAYYREFKQKTTPIV